MTTDTERAGMIEQLHLAAKRMEGEPCLNDSGLLFKAADYIEQHPPVDAGWGKSAKGDMRKIDGAWWVCTDPDMDRWITHGEMTAPVDAAVERDAARYRIAREEKRWQLHRDRVMSADEVDAYYDAALTAQQQESRS